MIKQRLAVRTFALAVALLPALAYAAEDDWRLDKNEDGVRVYTRAVEDSALREFRAETTVDASVEETLRLLDDADNLCAWLADCKKAQRMKQIDEYTAVNYVQYDQPWPASDRDMYVRSQAHVDEEAGSAVVELKGVPDYRPEKKGHVRIPYLEGHWRFTPAEDGKTKVVYQVHAEPGGSVPGFLANRAAVDAPLETLKNLRQQLREPDNS